MQTRGVPLRILPASTRPALRIVEAAGAGFPSPAQDWEETGIDLVALLSLDRAASFVFRVAGDSMTGAGIEDGDTLVVDRDVDARNGSFVIAVCDGGFVVRLCDEQVEIWGVVRTIVRNVRPF